MSETRFLNRRRLVWLIVVAVLLVGTLAITAYRLATTVQNDARVVGAPIPVQTLPATVKSMHEVVGASGTIQPSMLVNTTAKVIARVLTVPVDLGTIVRPGDLLCEFDPQLYAANLSVAQATYDHALKQLQRMESLEKKKFASAVDLETARVAVASAMDTVISAKIDLANTRVVSPAPAVIIEREVNPGEMSHIDETLFQLGILDPVLMDAAVTEDKIGYVYLGMPAEVGTDAFPGMTFKGTVTKIDSLVNDTTRTFGAYVQLTNHSLQLKKGVTGYARLLSTRMALTVPTTAIMNPVGDRATVFTVGTNQRAQLREVRIGLNAEGMTEILDDLHEGDQVVVVGQYNLRDNDLVKVNRYAPWNR